MLFIYKFIRVHGIPQDLDVLLKVCIALLLFLLLPYMLPIYTPDLGSYVTELSDYDYGLRLDFFSWGIFKFLNVSSDVELRWLAFLSLLLSLMLVWLRRDIRYAALFLISQLPVLPMILGSQIRLCLAVQFFMLMMVFMPRSRRAFLLSGLFHSSFWLLAFLPLVPIFAVFSDSLIPYMSFVGGIKVKIAAYGGEQDVRSLFSGLDLLLCLVLVFISAFYTNRKYPMFLGGVLIVLALVPEFGLPWVVVRRLTEVFLVVFSPLYFIATSLGQQGFRLRFFTVIHCMFYIGLFVVNYLKYGFGLSRLNFLI